MEDQGMYTMDVVDGCEATAAAAQQQNRDLKRGQLLEELKRLERLPSRSSYAVHRKRVVSKALELLDKKDHTSAEADELGALLNSLSF